MPGIDGGELVARTLKEFGVEVAFGLHGGHLDSLLIGLHRNGIRQAQFKAVADEQGITLDSGLTLE
jgi:thiamine pyrophosphate-dependent acetolactate synthase large subunit-like protein